jgi:type I restriction-modification system DNA methylase subunit
MPLERYLTDLLERRNRVKDESGNYDVLLTLLNEVGNTLKPKIKITGELKDKGADHPDMGLFAEKSKDDKPTHGVIEVKKTSIPIDNTLASDQIVKKYLPFYKVVIVTNYYQFALVTEDSYGKVHIEERYTLADSEAEFWELVQSPHLLSQQHEVPLQEYLSRAMQRTAPISKPEDVAKLLASYAREAKARLEFTHDSDSLTQIRKDLQNALDTTFEGKKGEQFFLSTLVQTMFYGMFSSWVLWHERIDDTQTTFNWLEERDTSNIPVISELFFHLSNRRTLESLGIKDILTWTTDSLNRVNREQFFKAWDADNAIQYFYEPFLKSFDPDLRKQLGVWYTPPEIVRYMVEKVEQTLQAEWGVGLADDDVYILDPCCGTGAYVVEVLKLIYKQSLANGEGDNAGRIARKAIQKRLFGFEILPSPFVVAHLQIALLLSRWNAPIAPQDRAQVYLTNALTDWESNIHNPRDEYLFAELKAEVTASQAVKRGRKIMVVLGNPPYNAFAGTSPKEEMDLVQRYKKGLREEWGINKYNLDDLYIRFFRIAERAISELNQDQRGIVCYISNGSWVEDPSFVVLRQNLLNSFHEFWLENMHGDRMISEVAPDGKSSQSVFSMKGVSSGIEQGTAISLWVRREKMPIDAIGKVWFRDDLNASNATQRRADLLASLVDPNAKTHYLEALPKRENRFSFRPRAVNSAYQESMVSLTNLCSERFSGLAEDRKKSLFGIDKNALERRMKAYFDRNTSWDDLSKLVKGLTDDVSRFDAKDTRKKVLEKESYDESRVQRYLTRPFDIQWCYYSSIRPLWREPRPDYWKRYEIGRESIITRFKPESENEGFPIFFSSQLADYHAMPRNSSIIPFYLRKTNKATEQTTFLGDEIEANLSLVAREYLANFGITDVDTNPEHASLIWLHALAIGYASDYLSDNQSNLQLDYPRIPLPKDKDLLFASAQLGRKVADLLDMDKKVNGVTHGTLTNEVVTIAVPTAVKDSVLLSGWGRPNRNGVGATVGKLVLHDKSYDVYLNKTDDAHWKNIPHAVWNYRIGGYPVLNKWLSYRDNRFLGRALNTDDIREFMHIVRRISALLALTDQLNANYQAMKI